MTYEVKNANSRSTRSSGPAVNWGPLLFKTTLQESHFHDLFRDTCTVYDEKIDYRRHLAGKISSEYLFNDTLHRNWSNKLKKYLVEYFEFLKFHKAIPDHNTAEYFHNCKTVLDMLQIDSMWANFQKKLEYNPLHDHSGFLSFVAYIDVPEAIRAEECIDTTRRPAGSIQFINRLRPSRFRNAITPRDLTYFLEDMLNPIDDITFSPVSGDLFIFPSYLTHQVSSFESDVTRISVSGNWGLAQ